MALDWQPHGREFLASLSQGFYWVYQKYAPEAGKMRWCAKFETNEQIPLEALDLKNFDSPEEAKQHVKSTRNLYEDAALIGVGEINFCSF